MVSGQAGRVQTISRLFYLGQVVSLMQYFTPEEIAKAKEVDLLTYLQQYEPQELVHVYGSTYCTREHDSLKISNGKWHWFSHGFGGVSALDYHKAIPLLKRWKSSADGRQHCRPFLVRRLSGK